MFLVILSYLNSFDDGNINEAKLSELLWWYECDALALDKVW